MAVVFAIVAIGGATGLGVRFAAAAGDGAAAVATGSTAEDPTPSPTGPADPSASRTDPVNPSGSSTPSADPSASPTDSEQPAPGNEDYVDIADAGDAAPAPARGANASSGSFISRCGRNENGHRNSDNFIVAPGVSNGAHHMHDYVGNLSTDATSTNESLAAAGTTCRLADRSTYFWPVLRDIQREGDDVDQPGGGQDGNFGKILIAERVSLRLRGNAQSKVVAMPRFLRIITGDAKAFTNGPNAPNARAAWTCSGTPGKVSTTQYPLCPARQLVQRTSEFPGCWNGVDIDSANHRAHTAFADRTTGACPTGMRAIPQLQITLSYRVPAGRSYALDTFPEQLRKAVTDHNDFTNVMPDRLMRYAVRCINSGRRC
jgi:Domain of unknown function (DUF1996)